MTQKQAEKPVSVGLAVLPQTAPAVLYSLAEVLASVGSTWAALTGQTAGKARMGPNIVAQREGLSTCAMDVPVRPDATFASVCTGALLLAEAGVLDDREATSHWSAVPLFEQFYPRVRLRPERVVSAADPARTILTSGGSASWAELALYLITHFCGREEAIRVSKIYLLGDRSEGQLPFAAMLRPQSRTDSIIEKCQVWIAAHYDAPNSVAQMINYSGLAPRTFKRRFSAATDYTPIEYVQILRVEEAKHLLETMTNILDTGRCGILFLVPNTDLFLRVNGRATVTRDPALLEAMPEKDKIPKAAIRIGIREAYFHCGKAIKRSRIWEPETWREPDVLPMVGRMIRDQAKLVDMTAEELEEMYRTELKDNLY